METRNSRKSFNSKYKDVDSTQLTCDFCSLLFKSRCERNAHTLEHFDKKSCSDCGKNVIRIGDEWYELHVHISCTTLKSESPHEEDSEAIPAVEQTVEALGNECIFLENDYSADMLDESNLKIENDEQIDDAPGDFSAIEQQNEDQPEKRRKKCSARLEKPNSAKAGFKPYACDECESRFYTEGVRDLHKIHVHSSQSLNAEGQPDELSVKSVDDSAIHNDDMSKPDDGLRSFKYVCAYCHCSFYKIKQHIEKEHGEGSNQCCNICSEKFDSPSSLLSHMESSHKFIVPINDETSEIQANTNYILMDGEACKKSLSCDYCERTFESFHKLQSHIKLRHKGNNKFACNNCDKEYLSEGELVKHERSIHNILFRYKCEVDGCNQEFVLRRQYKKHQKENHRDKPVFGCTLCEKTFQSKYSLQEHMALHSGVKSYICQTCGDRFVSAHRLNKHKRAKHSSVPIEEFRCTFDNCERTFRSKFSRDDHALEHDVNTKRFGCDKCKSSYVTKSKLKLHQKRVHGPPSFMCSICGAAHRAKQCLENHIRIHHTGEKPFVCNECDKSFHTSSRLAAHKLIHTGEKRYRCTEPGCDRAYMYDVDLKRHKFSAHGIYYKKHPCPICSNIFPENKLLKKHLATHD